MINEINANSGVNAAVLTRASNATDVGKLYKKALLKIHPDKHMGDWKQYMRATEMFKTVNASYSQYKRTGN